MKRKKESFLQAVFALMFSQIAVKFFGMVYSLYLTNKNGFGDKGNAICMSAYQIYAIFLCVCSIGIPNGISKMVSESLAIGDVIGSKRIFKVALGLFSMIGMICSIFLYSISGIIANKILGISTAEGILKILAPSIVFIAISSVIRGYFNGRQKIGISAKIQTVEQIIKTILTVIFVEIISRKSNGNTDIMAEFSMLAACIATIISFLYTVKEYVIIAKEDRIDIVLSTFKIKQPVKKIIKELFIIVIPIAITSLLAILEGNIDSITIIRLLKNKIGEDMAREIYGILASKVNLLTGFAVSLNGAVAIALIPEISKANAKGNIKELEEKIHFSFLITMFIAIPIMLIMSCFSLEIINFLYPNANRGANLLRLSSVTIIFSVIAQNMAGILQGIGKFGVHLKIMIFAIVLKFFLNCLLIPNAYFLEKGAMISSSICDIFIFIFLYKRINKELKINIRFLNDLLKLFLIGLISIFLSKFMFSFIMSFRIRFLVEVFFFGILYILLTSLFSVFDLKMLLKSIKL